MKFIIDQQLPPCLAEWLRGQDFDARHVREFGMSAAPDQAIWESAQSEAYIVVTKDEDFVRLWRARAQGGVIWVRLGNCDNPTLISRFEAQWPQVLTRLRLGDRFIEIR